MTILMTEGSIMIDDQIVAMCWEGKEVKQELVYFSFTTDSMWLID